MTSVLSYFVLGMVFKDITVSAFAVSSTEKVYALNGGNVTFRIVFTLRNNEEFIKLYLKCNSTVIETPFDYGGGTRYSGLCYGRYRGRCQSDLELGKNNFTITVFNVSSLDEGQCSLQVHYRARNTISSLSHLVVENTTDSTGSGRVVDITGSAFGVTSTVAYNNDKKTATFRIVCTLRDNEVIDEVFFKYKSVNVFEVRQKLSDGGKFLGLYQRRGSSTFSPGKKDFTITLSNVTSADEGQYTVDVTVKGSFKTFSFTQLIILVKPTGTPSVNTETPTVKRTTSLTGIGRGGAKPSANQSLHKVPPADTKTTSLSGNRKDGAKPATGSVNTAPSPDTSTTKSGSGKGAVSADRASKFLPCVASVVMAMSYTTG